MNFIKKWALKRAVNKIKKISANEAAVDEMLVAEVKRSADINRTADKILKAKILRQTTNATLEKIQELNEEEPEEPEGEEEGGFEEMIGKALINKFIGGGGAAAASADPAGMVAGLEKKAEDFGMSKEEIAAFKQSLKDGKGGL